MLFEDVVEFFRRALLLDNNKDGGAVGKKPGSLADIRVARREETTEGEWDKEMKNNDNDNTVLTHIFSHQAVIFKVRDRRKDFFPDSSQIGVWYHIKIKDSHEETETIRK